MHHVTVLAAAFALSGDERYAERAASHLRSWWAQNPFLSGVHWTSGIETGLRLISWVWVRRLLEAWEEQLGYSRDNEVALAQIWWHQHYLASFRSRGSSANNHVIAEAAGLLVAALPSPGSPRVLVGRRTRSRPRAGAREQHIPKRRQPGDGIRVPRLRRRSAIARGAEADRSNHPLSEDLLGPALPHARGGGGDRRRQTRPRPA